MAAKIKTVNSTSGPFTYSQYVITSFEEGKEIAAELDGKAENFLITKTNNENVKLIKALKNAYDNNNRPQLLTLIKSKESILYSGNRSVVLGDVLKPAKEVPELGYIGEAIIQAGIFARFVSKDKNITRIDIENNLNEFLDSYKRKDKNPQEKESPNYQFKGSSKVPHDIVKCIYELAPKYCDWLLKANGKYNISPYNALDTLFRDAVAFANSPTVTSQSKEIYFNKRQDYILIEGTGVSGQNKTKADIKVYKYVGYQKGKSPGVKTEINLRISAKIKDITQFGQVSGLTWDKQEFLFNQLFSVNINGVKNSYDKLVPEPSMLIDDSSTRLKAYALIYQEAVKQFNLSSNKIQKLVNGIKHFMTLNEEETGGVSLFVVSIGGGGLSISDTSRLSVDKLKKYMKDNKYTERDIKAVYRQTDASRIIYVMIGDETLLDLNGRWTANRCANYVSGGPALYNIIKLKM